ncbi:MAG: hypothetical protein AAF512_22325, partial [Pseudomonadota bacterium]
PINCMLLLMITLRFVQAGHINRGMHVALQAFLLCPLLVVQYFIAVDVIAGGLVGVFSVVGFAGLGAWCALFNAKLIASISLVDFVTPLSEKNQPDPLSRHAW